MRLLTTLLTILAALQSPFAADPPEVALDTAQQPEITSGQPASDTLAPAPYRFALHIERIEINDGHLNDTLDIMFESNGHTLAGFDLKLGVASNLIDILDILPGEIYDSCRWEYFFSGPSRNPAPSPDNPPVLWQAVALAEAVPDKQRPACYGFDRPASLLRVIVAGASREIFTDTTVPIFFFWEDCTDNTISGTSGDTIFVSGAVYDYVGDELPEPKGLFPSRRGAPQQCISPAQAGRILRDLELHNGGVTFRFVFDTTTATSQ